MGKLYKFGDKVENLIKDIRKENITGEEITVQVSNTGVNALVNKDYKNLTVIGKTYTLGFKIKAENSIKAYLSVCKYGTWTSYKNKVQQVAGGDTWYDIRMSFIADATDYRVVVGESGYTVGETVQLKEIYLIQGDYTNKKLPDIF